MARDFTALTNRAAMQAARTEAKYASEAYTPVALEGLSNEALTRELKQAREVLRGRSRRAGEFYTSQQERRISELLRPLRDIPMADRPEVLSSIAREISRGRSSRAGAREGLEKAVDQFQAAGYDFINMGNIKEFLDFADEFTSKEQDKSYGSGALLNYFEQQKARQAAGDKVKVSKRSFLLWLSK